MDIHGYRHMQVNHKREFLCNEKSGIVNTRNMLKMKRGEMWRVHTQNIERSWCSLRYNIPCFGRWKKSWVDYLAEYIWKKNHRYRERLHASLIHAADMHNHHKMGAFLDKPKTEKHNEHGCGNGLHYGVASMQGWRVEMEDAHCAVTGLSEELRDWSFFAVFDGHAGWTLDNIIGIQLAINKYNP
ncbi:hypothetical protein PR048_001348 [Dryococelus australis]|uniref:PPM-type phosphatase domain-containing protein n=1 Tax=Dryococelus australis TaxID=614101 RepID=A0ABQ9IH75_9NEOP|nr:hypothetical protein PR048_001348 [Dryococelus australis]